MPYMPVGKTSRRTTSAKYSRLSEAGSFEYGMVTKSRKPTWLRGRLAALCDHAVLKRPGLAQSGVFGRSGAPRCFAHRHVWHWDQDPDGDGDSALVQLRAQHAFLSKRNRDAPSTGVRGEPINKLQKHKPRIRYDLKQERASRVHGTPVLVFGGRELVRRPALIIAWCGAAACQVAGSRGACARGSLKLGGAAESAY